MGRRVNSAREGLGSGDDAGKPSRETSGGECKPLTIKVLGAAKAEGRAILTAVQYAYVVEIEKRLVHFGNKAETADLRITPFGDFWSLKLKGNFLGKTNLRIYFAHVPERNEIVVLMTYKKEEERRVSPHVSITLEDRLEGYLAGKTEGVSVFRGRYR